MSDDAIQSVLQENRQFPPAEAFSADAHISSDEQYQEMWQRAKDDPDGSWGELARENLDWIEPFEQVSEGDMPDMSSDEIENHEYCPSGTTAIVTAKHIAAVGNHDRRER